MTGHRSACSRQRNEDGRCYTCDHTVEEHDAALTCRLCSKLDQERLEQRIELYAWWRSQQ